MGGYIIVPMSPNYARKQEWAKLFPTSSILIRPVRQPISFKHKMPCCPCATLASHRDANQRWVIIEIFSNLRIAIFNNTKRLQPPNFLLVWGPDARTLHTLPRSPLQIARGRFVDEFIGFGFGYDG
jgi:hypothetical protein